ncbi:HET-domain-containing protein [Pyrenochaeta sp. DS3sAY3a]|nr:HET-domain-containing protein [Pyrenochaeta sp. DS3sAY3a]
MSLPKLNRPNSTGGSTKPTSPLSRDPATASSQNRVIDATSIQRPRCTVSLIERDTCTLCLVLNEGGSSRSNFGQISASKTNGCGGCSLIIESIMSMKARREIHGQLTVRLQSENGYFYIKLPIHTLQPLALFCLEGDQATPWAMIPTIQTPLTAFSSKVPMVKRWIEQCEEQHAICREPSLSQLPTRVIDVGSETQDAHLFIPSNGEKARYATLSHCWGKARPLTLTRETLDQYCSAMPLIYMPKTFQEAITITRALDIRYLWIDSVCIVQDDKEDWEMESSRMAHVYWNSYLTIAADRAKDSHDGIFQPESENQLLRYATMKNVKTIDVATQKGVSIQVRALGSGDTLHQQMCPGKSGLEEPNHLDARAWVLQEKCLSRRTLIFGNEVAFRCRMQPQNAYCECMFRGQEQIAQPLVKQCRPGYTVDSISSASEPILFGQLWETLVEDFTARNITHDSDRLPAISAIAATRQEPKDVYLAGLWRKHLDVHLLWYKVGSKSGSHYSSYYAPSWSWASFSGRIYLPRRDLPEAIWEIVDAFSISMGKNPYGTVLYGEISIYSMFATVRPCDIKNKSPFWRLGLKLDNDCEELVFTDVFVFGRRREHLYGPQLYRGLVLRRSKAHPGAYERLGIFNLRGLHAPRSIALFGFERKDARDDEETVGPFEAAMEKLRMWNAAIETGLVRLV